MFGKTSQGDLNGFLDAGSRIKGELGFEDTFRVDGHVEGGVVSSGVLIVGELGEIDGDVNVPRVYVSGVIRGRVQASEYLEITSTGRVFADLEVVNLKIEEGAVFEGRCTMEAAKNAESSGKTDGSRTEVDDETPSNVTRLPQRSSGAKVS